VVLTILKNISQWEGLSHILWKIKNVPNHQTDGIHGGFLFDTSNTKSTGWVQIFPFKILLVKSPRLA
jgi:hypothetical protein